MPAASTDTNGANLDVFYLFSLLSSSLARSSLSVGKVKADRDRKWKAFGATDAMRDPLDEVRQGL